jgi:hypothetical protein
MPTEALTIGLRPSAALRCPRQDQVPFKFRETAQHRKHQPPVRRGRIRPGIIERLEARADFANRIERIE